jgi:hypothetical protein
VLQVPCTEHPGHFYPADTHYRQLARLLSRKTVLWTEMVVDKTVIHTNQLDK